MRIRECRGREERRREKGLEGGGGEKGLRRERGKKNRVSKGGVGRE